MLCRSIVARCPAIDWGNAQMYEKTRPNQTPRWARIREGLSHCLNFGSKDSKLFERPQKFIPHNLVSNLSGNHLSKERSRFSPMQKGKQILSEIQVKSNRFSKCSPLAFSVSFWLTIGELSLGSYQYWQYGRMPAVGPRTYQKRKATNRILFSVQTVRCPVRFGKAGKFREAFTSLSFYSFRLVDWKPPG